VGDSSSEKVEHGREKVQSRCVSHGVYVSRTLGGYGSYGMNGYVSNSTPGMLDPWGRDLKNNWRSVDVRGAYNIPLFLDCVWLGGLPVSYDSPPEFEGMCEFGDFGVNMQGFCINRHNGFINGLSVDFSARKIGLKELWRLKWHRAFDTHADLPVWPDWLKGIWNYDEESVAIFDIVKVLEMAKIAQVI